MLTSHNACYVKSVTLPQVIIKLKPSYTKPMQAKNPSSGGFGRGGWRSYAMGKPNTLRFFCSVFGAVYTEAWAREAAGISAQQE